MKEDIRAQFDYFYQKLNLVQKETIINQDQKKTSVIITNKLAPQIWELITDADNYDLEKAKKIIAEERDRIAEQMYQQAKVVLRIYNGEQWAKDLIKKQTLTTAMEKVMYCEEIYGRLGIRDPYDSMNIAPIEHKGVVLGVKRIADNKEGEHDNIFKELQKDLNGLGV